MAEWILPENARLPRNIQGSFTYRKIYGMGQTALLHFWRKAFWGFFRPEKSDGFGRGLNLRTWVPKASTLPLDHRSRAQGQWKLCPEKNLVLGFGFRNDRTNKGRLEKRILGRTRRGIKWKVSDCTMSKRKRLLVNDCEHHRPIFTATEFFF